MKVVVLPDGETFGEIRGSMVVDVPDSIKDIDDIETFLRKSNYYPIYIEYMVDSLSKDESFECQIVDDKTNKVEDYITVGNEKTFLSLDRLISKYGYRLEEIA